MTKLKRIEDIYEKAVKKVAAEGKYDYVFEADALKVGGEDITDKVLKTNGSIKIIKLWGGRVMEYKVTDIITLLNAEYKGEVIENVSKLSPFFIQMRRV